MLDLKCRDLRGVDDFCWDTRSVGEGILFLSLCWLLGVGTVYVTSLENFADVLFGVGVASFIFCRRVAFLFRVAGHQRLGARHSFFCGLQTLFGWSSSRRCYCKRGDLRGVDDFCWDTPSLGEGIFFIGLGQILGVGTVYVTSLENFAAVLFGVGVVSFNFRRRIAFLFCVAAAYVISGEVFGGVSTLGSGAGCG